MPFASKKQQRYFFAAEQRGELPKGTAIRWAHHTKNIKNLPEYSETEKARYARSHRKGKRRFKKASSLIEAGFLSGYLDGLLSL